MERQAQAVPCQQRRQRRPQYQADGIGRTQRGHGPGPVLWPDMVGDQGIATHRYCGVEGTDAAAREHQPDKGKGRSRQPAQGTLDEQAQQPVGQREAGTAQQQDPPTPQAIGRPAPWAGQQHPDHTGHGHRRAGLPGGHAQQACDGPDQGNEGHHRHGASHVGEQQRAQVQGAGRGEGGRVLCDIHGAVQGR